MYHTRQIKDWCRDNQYWQQYATFNEYDFVKGQLDRFGYKSIPIDDWCRTLNTLVGNQVYSRAHTELERRFPSAAVPITGISEVDTATGLQVRWHVSFRSGKYTLYLSYTGYDLYDEHGTRRVYNSMFFATNEYGEVATSTEYTGWLDREHISEFVKKYVCRKFFYGEGGAYTYIMIRNAWNRSRLKAHMRVNRSKELVNYNEQEVIRAIERRYNLILDGFYLDEAIRAARTLGRQKERTCVRKLDSSYLFDYLGDGDEDDAMKYIMDKMDEMKHPEVKTVFV